MNKKVILFMSMFFVSTFSFSQSKFLAGQKIASHHSKALVSYADYEMLVDEVKEVRAERLINFNQFLEFQKDKNTVILDTRSKKMYKKKHIKGAINLPFTEFTQNNLRKLIPDVSKRIIIYCNNNFRGDPFVFPSKTYVPQSIKSKSRKKSKKNKLDHTPIMLALNIPTYINLYGYGYRNIYELNEYIYIGDKRLVLAGKKVFRRKRK